MNFRKVTKLGDKLVINASGIDGTWLVDIDANIAVLPSKDFKRWLIATFDVPLFCNEFGDYIPFGYCPFAGSIIILSENGDVLEARGDIVYSTC